jgi:hypothetical protein
MSRSFKKTAIFAITTSPSEKEDKKEWHSNFRSKAKQNLNKAVLEDTLDEFTDINVLDVSDPFWFAKDGKIYYNEEELKNSTLTLRK